MFSRESKIGGAKPRHLINNIIFLGPTITFLTLMLIYPLIYSFYMSLHKWELTQTNPPSFVGFGNYLNLFKDPLFWHALKIQIIFVCTAIPLELIIGLLIALLFQVEFKGNSIMRTLLLLPFFILPSLSGTTWRFILHPTYGVFGAIYRFLGKKPVDWLSNGTLTFIAVILQDIWRTWPFMFITLYAALSNFPQELKEAAAIDGANKFQIFFRIILPLLVPAIIVAVFLRLIDALRIFSEVYVMTEGGPGNATTFLSIFIYKNAFRFFDMGYANAAGYVLTTIAMIVSAIGLTRIFSREVYEY
ncbi:MULTISPECIES: carbohydrate ABC transporter permease [Dictyoglomus]|uniref:Binding-protein-dependent transport systems inner membrane component n=1 Tax=Dictyoglomus turgidum (strain DSM 6724 / Z-1310) TaxID=515635 RepID=B8E203_DICTD|nr:MULTISPECIES: sugar ABC transporter permease [Dictyoglomus]ACK41786.1 binding-protein-dependent transport systems inner membrane component [Dictyoglomus turgidum DSM 6724]HBU31369.1 sugar ABC transporter permease [Dictyoglomus sp.]